MLKLETFHREVKITVLETDDLTSKHKVEFKDPDHEIQAIVAWIKKGSLWVIDGTKASSEKIPFPQCSNPIENANGIYKDIPSSYDKHQLFRNPNGCTHLGEMIYFSSKCLDNSLKEEDCKILRFEKNLKESWNSEAKITTIMDRGDRRKKESEFIFSDEGRITLKSGKETLTFEKARAFNDLNYLITFFRGAFYHAWFEFHKRQEGCNEINSIDELEAKRKKLMEVPQLKNNCFTFNALTTK